MEANKIHWKNISSVEAALPLIDQCVLLRWGDMSAIKRSLSADEQGEVISLFVDRLASAGKNRLISVVTVESALLWLASAENEALEDSFVQELLTSDQVCQEFISIAQSIEFIDQEHAEKIYAGSVVIICKLGLKLWERKQKQPRSTEAIDQLLGAIAAHLLSVSNKENTAIRLSLLQYFGYLAHRQESYHLHFNRILARFGFTLMEQLFALLEHAKCTNIAMHHLLELSTYILEADERSQVIFHNILKSFMLREPERFLGLVEGLSSLHHLDDPADAKLRGLFFHHLCKVTEIAIETSHKKLVYNLLCLFAHYYREPDYGEIVNELLAADHLKPKIRYVLKDLSDLATPAQLVRFEAGLRMKKRGRKPQRIAQGFKNPLTLVSYLSKCELQNAS